MITPEQYEMYLQRAYELMDAPVGSLEEEQLMTLVDDITEYEDEHYPMKENKS